MPRRNLQPPWLALRACPVQPTIDSEKHGGIVAPLQAVARHEQHIRYHYEATVAAPAILVIGIFYSTLGSRASRLLGLKGAEHPTQLGLALLGVLVLAGFILHGRLHVHADIGGRSPTGP
jgi:hypothetical protein